MRFSSKKDFLNAEGQRIPGPPPSLFRLGNLSDFYRHDPTFVLQSYVQKYPGDALLFWCGSTPHLIPRNPEMIQQILANKQEHFKRNSDTVQALFRSGILTSDGERWRQKRKTLTPPFQSLAIAQSVPIILKHTQILVEAWREKQNLAFKPTRDLSTLMLKILGEFVFGFDFHPVTHGGKTLHHSLVTLTKDSVMRSFSPIPYWKVYTSSKIHQAQRVLTDTAQEILEHAWKRIRTHQPLSGFMTAVLEKVQAQEWSEEEAIDEIINFFVAGHETSATALSWLLAMLAKHQDVQQQCYREIESVLQGQLPDAARVSKLIYLQQTIQETLRLYPPVPLSPHIATEDTTLNGYAIPRGTHIDLCSLITHRDPQLWEKPLEFMPERFDSDSKRIHSHQYFPFLLGKHTCIGMRLAQLELTVACTVLLQNFHITPLQGTLREDLRVSLHPSGFQIQLSDRHSSSVT